MKHLLLTLGHNSSAILIENEQIVWGYETERLSGLKSDSRFPAMVLNRMGMTKPDIIYVTHWAPTGKLSDMGAKYWTPEIFDGIPVRTLSTSITHHDTHMAAAINYAGPKFPLKNTYGIVLDGFGTMGEHLSIYDLSSGHPQMVRRIHGYGTSLGLWYQYATAFLDMKMHEDEYKLLGYETRIPETVYYVIESLALTRAKEWIEEMSKSIYGSKFDPMYNLNALPAVKDKIFKELSAFCKTMGVSEPSSPSGRAVVARYVQAVLEHVVLTLIGTLKPSNLILSGGCFYNVKLNKLIVDTVDGLTCIYPLAGDQGNALGLYSMVHPKFHIPDDLCWGKRELHDIGKVTGLYVVTEREAMEIVPSVIKNTGYVNLVRGNMEFGPRALCNTSTLALPNLHSVELINQANNRNTVMPMAPVMTEGMYHQYFQHTERVWKSHKHMIVAMEYTEHPWPTTMGIAHEYQYPYKHHTGRPQVIDKSDVLMHSVLTEIGYPLINTSFNYHGKPIAFDMPSIIDNHMMQRNRDSSFTTVVIKNV